MAISNIDTEECALCGAQFTPIEDPYKWEVEAEVLAGCILNNPGRSWVEEANEQLGLDRSDETCIPCYVNRVDSVAWELRKADEDEYIQRVQERATA